MSTRTNQVNLIQLLRRIPPQWAFSIIGIVLVYWLGQPILNRTFGWNLPSIAKMMGEPGTQIEGAASKTPAKPKAEKSLPSKATKKTEIKPTESATDPRDFLTEVALDRYQSPAGLFYTRGSEEGHRLKHLAKHLKDDPIRPGSHGVFDGDLIQVLQWIDDAYLKAKKGDRNTRTRKEGESTVYEVTFGQPIGFVGGSDGKRKGNPSTKRLRIVVIGQNVITAFPF